MDIVNSWKIVARPQTVGRLPPGYDNFDARGGPKICDQGVPAVAWTFADLAKPNKR